MKNFRNIYDESEYEILFKEFYTPLVQFAFQIINDNEAAKDIVQDLFVQLWEKELTFTNELVLRTYYKPHPKAKDSTTTREKNIR